MSMLEINGLTKTYGNGVRALDGVSLSVPKGMFGLLGPNGAGKSSLMRTIATLQTADEGSIQFGEMDVLKEPQALRATLGYLPQDFGVYPRMSARAMLDHLAVLKGISNGKERKHLVETLLEQTNLTQHAKKSVASYSGGMRQRFGIARVLAMQPDLMICDEPVAALDVSIQAQIINLFLELTRDLDLTTIFISHDLSVVQHVSDRIAIRQRAARTPASASRPSARPGRPTPKPSISSVKPTRC